MSDVVRRLFAKAFADLRRVRLVAVAVAVPLLVVGVAFVSFAALAFGSLSGLLGLALFLVDVEDRRSARSTRGRM